MIRRYPYLAMLSALVLLAVTAPARSQLTEKVTIGMATSGPAAETRLFEVYQAIFSLVFSSRSTLSQNDMKQSVVEYFRAIGLRDVRGNHYR